MSENKFSPRAEEVLRLAQEAAGELGHGYVGSEHLLLGLIREKDGLAHQVLTENGLTADMIRNIIVRSVGSGLPGSDPAQGLTPRAKRVIEIAVEESMRGGFGYAAAAFLSAADETVKVLHFGIDDQFVQHGTVSQLHVRIGLDAASMTDKIIETYQKL